ncbi:protein kinase domain-containing protein [Crateriforma spongiae]|uniref:protein kinase domain-containing protein n=1 Tax=Crateriforma spongiae TaxID=2724528 RepID=UPI0014487E50|nr:protein kinase [Crateriforma spongiae]
MSPRRDISNKPNDESPDSPAPHLEPTQYREPGDTAASAPTLERTLADATPREHATSEQNPSEQAATDRQGERVHYFGDYELLEEIARGGMGIVYKAQQTRLKRLVAVKMILGGALASEQNVKRFLVEAEASANLDHPGIVPVYDFGEHGGTNYFSMAYVDGPSLAEKVGEHPMPADEAAALILKIADAVAYAHAQGVIHRDLKPENVLIDRDGQPRITDFGLAKLIDSDDELTQDGAIMGSVFYMPPEQASGQKSLIGPTADIYALGAMLYKLLTGHPPFQGPTAMETLNQVIHQDPIPLRRINSRIPRDLETICLKCLHKDIKRRFRTANELVEELTSFRRGEPIRSRPVGQIEHLWRWCRRNPLPTLLSAGLLFTVFFAAITVTTFLNRAKAEQRRFEQQQRSVETLSNMVLSKTLSETDEWLRLFFQPVEQQLSVTGDRVGAGLIDVETPKDANDFLVPLIEYYPQVSSLMIADDRGREHMLLRTEQQIDGQTNHLWRCRQTRLDQWQDEVRWTEWTSKQPTIQQHTESLSYDPRTRPWFRTAVNGLDESNADQNRRQAIHWTEPYLFFTTKDLGITASMAIPDSNGGHVTTVVAFDLLLQDITRFTTRKQPTQNGKLLVLTEDARLVALPKDAQFATPMQWKQWFMKPLEEINQPYATQAASVFSFNSDRKQIYRFESNGDQWWGAAKQFQLGDELTLWMLVLLPERDLHKRLSEQ